MKKMLVLMPLIATLALAGCVTTTQQAGDKVKEVQDWVRFTCGFLPTAATITSLFNAGVGSTISSVGGTICAAITTAPLADGPGAVVRVGKVRIRGTYVASGRKI